MKEETGKKERKGNTIASAVNGDILTDARLGTGPWPQDFPFYTHCSYDSGTQQCHLFFFFWQTQ